MKAVVAGATGLVGSFLVEELANDSAFTEVVALTRKDKESTGKIKWQKIDFKSHTELQKVTSSADVVFCCLGTTMKKAGTKNAFLEVDYAYVTDLAEAAAANKVRQFSVISAMGANLESKIFYNHVKGRMEIALRQLKLDELIIFHPSILLGTRDENRTGEKIGIVLGKLIAPLLFGSFKKYHPIEATDLAKAMCHEAKKHDPRTVILTYPEIINSSI